MAAPYYSLIIPVFNEKESLSQLFEQLTQTLVSLKESYEIIFVDDGSKDGSLQKLTHFAEIDDRVKIISFYNNYGKSAAYMAGFDACRGELIFTLDSDLQDVPSEMPRLLEAIFGGYDLAVGWKQNRIKNEPLRKISSYFYNRLKYTLFGVNLHDSNSGFRCMRRAVAKSLHLSGDQYRFIPEFAHMHGFKVTEVPTEHRGRLYGQSKYGWSRFVTGIMDLLSVRYLSSYSAKPLHFFGKIGLLVFAMGSIIEIYVLLEKLSGSLFQTHVAAIVIGALCIILSFIFLAIGLLAEIIISKKEDFAYSIRLRKGYEDEK